MKILYLSYDGMADPLGGSQVLPYLKQLSARGHRFWLVSCEKPEAGERAWERVRNACDEAGISWHPLRYHKRPPVLSTVWDIMAMKRSASRLQRRIGFDLVHCRSYVPALVGLEMKRRDGIPFLFDMRGFWPEERLEGGGWSRSPLLRSAYRYFKDRERDFFREADAIVSLTDAARVQMMARPPGERPCVELRVIPCCVDLVHFTLPGDEERLAARSALGIALDAPVLCYLGSLGNNYLLDEMLRFFVAFRERKPGARFLFVTREPAAAISRAAASRGIDADALVIRSADRDEVPFLLGAADVGIAFKQSSFAEQGCSPTKLGEMMATGIPVVVNRGVGDVDAVIEDTGAGIIVDGFGDQAMQGAVDRLDRLSTSRQTIRAGAERWFALEQGAQAYDSIYRGLAARASGPAGEADELAAALGNLGR